MSNGIPDHFEQKVQNHDERISRNEQWRLQAQGALKMIALMLGAGFGAWALDIFLNIF